MLEEWKYLFSKVTLSEALQGSAAQREFEKKNKFTE